MEKLYENIENYLLGKLTAAERHSFEKRMDNEADLKEEVDAFRIARNVVEHNIADKLRDDFQTWDREVTPKKEAKVVRLRRRYRLAAIAASAILVLFTFWYNANQQYNSNSLALSIYDMDELVSVRGHTSGDTALKYGEAAMQASNYPAAITHFLTVETTEEAYPDAQFMLANTYFLAGQLSKSQTTLEPLLQSDNILLKEKSEWLMVLSLLKNGQKSSAKFQVLLNRIAANENHSFYPKAIKLKEILSGFWVKLVK